MKEQTPTKLEIALLEREATREKLRDIDDKISGLLEKKQAAQSAISALAILNEKKKAAIDAFAQGTISIDRYHEAWDEHRAALSAAEAAQDMLSSLSTMISSHQEEKKTVTDLIERQTIQIRRECRDEYMQQIRDNQKFIQLLTRAWILYFDSASIGGALIFDPERAQRLPVLFLNDLGIDTRRLGAVLTEIEKDGYKIEKV